MNDDPATKKLNYQLQQMAFQKYPFQINNINFFCLETYFEDQLLNGVDLQIKEAKGMTSQPQKISYIAQSQQIIMPMGSNIISYNAQKRSYSLLTQVDGFVQILRTYTSKISNRTYIFWLQTDEQGLNMRSSNISQNKLNPNLSQQQNNQKNEQKITSIWNIDPVADILMGKLPDKIKENQNSQTKSKINESPKKVKFCDDDKPKSKKKVRIQAPQQQQQDETKNKKRMRICIFDYEKKNMVHKQPLEIQQGETISEIFLYFITEKMVGYVINDQTEERGKIYYKKIKIEDSYNTPKTSSKRMLNKKKSNGYTKKIQKFNVLDSIFEIPLLKYNGETDQYLFKDLNTVYSLQVYQVEHQMAIKKTSSKTLLQGQKPSSPKIISQHSIQISEDSQIDEQNLSKEIEKITNKIITSSKKRNSYTKEKYKIKISEEIELFTDETIVDISINEVYLVVLTNEFIRFYSIFNLNTLMFKCDIFGLKENPAPSSVELNKSYLLLTHQNSTLVSCYTILQRKLKHNSTCSVEIEHCQSIVKLFMNSYNCEVAILARQFEIEGRMTNILKSKKIIQNPVPAYKKTYLDISLAYVNFSSTKCEAKALFLKNQRFRNILTCKWHSQYLIQTENQILAKDWRQGFQNLKCSCLHPTGQYLIIGFNDCFKLYAVTQQGLQNTYMSDGVKDCQAIAYSQYGEHFAVGSSNTIGVYNSYNCRKKITINLPMGSLVETLEYRSNHLICILRTKRIIIFHSLLDYKEIFTFNPKNYLSQNKHELQKRPGQSVQNLMALTIKGLVSIDVNSLYYDLELNVVIFSSGKKIFFLNVLTNESLGSYEMESISCMEYNKHLGTLFLGTSSGELIAFPWPNKPSNILSELPRFKFHSQKIIKIKLTTDFKYLISLGHDMSIYKSHVSYVLNLKRLKGNQIAQYKGNKNATAYCNFLQNRGICQFSHSQTVQKLQVKKQLEQEVVNTVFMLPEQRMKQKQQLFEQISTTQEELAYENMMEYKPLQEESVQLRNKIIKMKEDLIKIHKVRQFAIEKEKETYLQQTSKLLKTFSQLHYGCRLVKLELQEDINRQKQQDQTKYTEFIKENQVKEKQLLMQIQMKQRQAQEINKNFMEIDLIQEEKKCFLQEQLSLYQKQLQMLTTKNGQLACKNSSIEKETLVVKYRIEELKFVIANAHHSIQKLKHKQEKQTEQKLVFQNLLVQNAKIDVSEMEKKYIKATKQLIEKNKVIDINLNQYEKEKEILVKLQKTVEGTQAEIDRIVDSLQSERDFMKYLEQRKHSYTARYKQLAEVRNNIKFTKNKGQLNLKKFIQQVQTLEKQLQTSLNQNRKDFCIQTHGVIDKLKNLSNKGYKKQHLVSQGQRSVRESSKNFNRDSVKNKQSQMFSRQTANPLSHLLSGLRKSTSDPSKSKKDKKIRFSTEGKNPLPISERSKTVNTKKRIDLKINHNKFREQFAKYRKDDCLNNTATNFGQQSQRIAPQQNQKLLKKQSKRYYQIHTQNSHQTQRINNNITSSTNTTKPFTNLKQNSQLQVFNSSYQREKQIDRQKQTVYKKLASQQKLLSKIRNEKKLFMTSKKRLHMQNQDLINTYNSLTYDNKYFKNILSAYEETLDEDDKNFIFNNPANAIHFSKNFITMATEPSKVLGHGKSSRNLLNQTITSKLNSKDQSQQKSLTPFDKYLKNKEKKANELKSNLTQSQPRLATGSGSFKPSFNKIVKTKTSQLQRIKTVPCVEFTL